MINLLPWREWQHKKNQQYVFMRLMLYAVFIFIVITIYHHFLLHHAMQLRQHALQLKSQRAAIILQHPHHHLLLLQRLKALRLQKTISLKNNKAIENGLATLANALPRTLTLTALACNPQKITVSGVGSRLSDIHHYTMVLQNNLNGKHVLLSSMQHDPHNTAQLHFTLQVTS